MIVCVTGGRFYSNRSLVFSSLTKLNEARRITILAHGATPTNKGADWHADAWALENGLTPRRFYVSRAMDGPWPYAGNRRNGRMLAAIQPEILLAFEGGNGTKDCVFRAKIMGIPIWEPDLQEFSLDLIRSAR